MEKNLNDLFYLIRLCFMFFLNLEILIVRYSVFGSKRLTTDSVACFFLSGLRHITVLKLLGVGEEVGGVLELFPINGKVLLL